MGRGDDKPGWTDREKLSFSELDRRRRERRDDRERRPQGERARQNAAAATKRYLKEIDGLFGSERPEAERLIRAMRDSHGTPKLAEACRAYRDAIGMPNEARDLSLFLDSGDAELVVGALRALQAGVEAGRLELSSGLRSQIRLLAQDRDDAVAEAAEGLLELG